MVLGSRDFSGNVPARSKIGNTATKALFALATGERLPDTQTGLHSSLLALGLLGAGMVADRLDHRAGPSRVHTASALVAALAVALLAWAPALAVTLAAAAMVGLSCGVFLGHVNDLRARHSTSLLLVPGDDTRRLRQTDPALGFAFERQLVFRSRLLYERLSADPSMPLEARLARLLHLLELLH